MIFRRSQKQNLRRLKTNQSRRRSSLTGGVSKLRQIFLEEIRVSSISLYEVEGKFPLQPTVINQIIKFQLLEVLLNDNPISTCIFCLIEPHISDFNYLFKSIIMSRDLISKAYRNCHILIYFVLCMRYLQIFN